MANPDLRRRLMWLITVRLVVSTTLLGWAMLMQVSSPGVEIQSFYLLIALTYGLSFLFGATVRLVGRHRWLLDAQFACDALIVSAFIAFTGGINSYFSSLYFLPIIAAGSLQLRRGALMVALLSAVVYVGVTVLQYQDASVVPKWLHAPTGVLPPARVALYTLVINLFAFFAVAYLAGSLAHRVQAAGARLELASTEIANLQALNEHVINSLTSGLVTTDYHGRVLTFNAAAEHITGHAAAETIGRSAEEVLQLPDGFVASLSAGLDARRSKRLDFTYRTPTAAIDIGLSATHLVTPSGPAGFLFNFQDVTNLKKLEREARMQHRLAAVGEMAAGIAHEIRNPLASISGSIQVLRQELQLNEEQGQLMDIVLRESERLNATIRSFLAYARPQRVAIGRLDIARVIRDAGVLLRNSGDVREGHVIDVEVPAGEVWYEADEGQIRQIVWNLATNALRAMPSGGRLRLSASLERRSDGGGPHASSDVIIAVEDDGVGIAQEDLDNIFQPFHGSFAKGSGLGLAIVHRIVSDYNGEIQVTSKEGAGTRIRVRLPAAQVAATA